MKKKLISLMLILTTVFQTGCWDMVELNEIGLVTVVGVDFSKDTNKYIVTVQIPNLSAQSSSSMKGSSDGMWIGSTEGSSIFEAVRNLVRISSKRITWSHNIIVILGESFAENDITPAVDFFTHNPQLRMKTLVVVSKGNAKDYVASKVGLDPIGGISYGNMNRFSALTGVSLKSDMLKLNSDFSGDYTQILIAGIDRKKAILTADDKNNINESNAIALEGAAVFKKNKMIGWLSPEETRGLAWILKNTKSTIVTTNPYVDDTTSKKVSVEVKNIKRKITSKIIDDIPNITITITGEGNIVEEDGTSNLTMAEFQKTIEKFLDKHITDEIKRGIDKVQKYYQSDVLGFAQIVRVQNNKIWKSTLKDDWPQIFSSIPIKIEVNINVNSSTLNQEPTRPTKGK